MREHWPAIVCICVLSISSALIAVMLVFHTIGLHPDAAGFLS